LAPLSMYVWISIDSLSALYFPSGVTQNRP